MTAWEHEYRFRKSLDPRDYRKEETEWGLLDNFLKTRKDNLFFFWKSAVPGSFAPDSLFYTAIQAWSNQGYDVTKAMELLPAAMEAHDRRDWGTLEQLTGSIFHEMYSAGKDPDHIASRFDTPSSWEDISSGMPEETGDSPKVAKTGDLLERTCAGWLAQICGGAYGTAIEGYTGDNLRRAYGEQLGGYISEPETYNDDITFQIALLSAVGRMKKGEEISSQQIAGEWLRLIFFGWSAEYCALENLRRGIFPPESGSFRNAYSEWIGAQMRTMVCGLLYPGSPCKAAHLAWKDSRISHTGNGIYGGIHSAVMTSLAYRIRNPRELLECSRAYIPGNTLFLHYFDLVMDVAARSSGHIEAWDNLEPHLRQYHWIHVIPNMAAVILALYYCERDLGKAFRILGECGLDVDCNAGEVGTILGVMNGTVPGEWANPIGEDLKTYVPGYEELNIRELAAWTVSLGSGIA